MASKNSLKLAEAHQAENVRAAHIIAADPAKYSGLMAQWAQAVIGASAPKIEKLPGRVA